MFLPYQLQPYTTFPLVPIDSTGACGCGDPTCKRAGKHPAIAWSKCIPGTHEPQVSKYSGGGRGIVTGRGLLVIDTDERPGKSGVSNLVNFARAHGADFPITYAVKTPTGGLHLYFRVPDGVQAATNSEVIAPGVDLRGEGGFAVVEGSPHANGGVYSAYANAPIAPLPEWLLPYVRKSEKPTTVEATSVVIELPEEEWSRRRNIFIAECQRHPEAISGDKGHNKLLMLVSFGVRTLALNTQFVFDTIKQIYNPRCSPPWSDREIAHKIQSALVHGHAAFNSIAPENFDADLAKVAAMAVAPKIVRSLYNMENAPARRRGGDPHEYSFNPATDTIVLGGDSAVEKPKAISLADSIRLLTTSPVWGGVWQHDTFNERVIAVHPPCPLKAETEGFSETDISMVRCWFERAGCKISNEQTRNAILAAACFHSYDPLEEYIKGLNTTGITLEDAEARLTKLAAVLIPSVSKMAPILLQRFMVGAVKRALVPGAKHDAMLVFVGPQGIGKSTSISALFGQPWYRSDLPDLENRDSSHALHGKWVVEFGELNRILRSDAGAVKEFLSREVDEYRAFNTGERIIRPRRSVFMGTTNELDFLRGGEEEWRRYWPIVIETIIQVGEIARYRDMYWTCAKVLFEKGVPNYLDKPQYQDILAELHGSHEEESSMTDPILKAIADLPFTTPTEAYLRAFAPFDPAAAAKLKYSQKREVGAILRKAGWVLKSVRSDDGSKKRYVRPQ